MPRTRDLARIDYSKLNAKGFDSDSFEMDVLNLSDPTSDLFDNEEYNIQKEIEQLSLSVSKRAAEKDRELRELYLQRGAIPRNVPNKVEQTSAPPVKESSAPPVKESSALPLKTVIGQTEEKWESDRKKSKKVGKNVSKKQPKKGELDLDDLRKNKEINKIVEKQLRYLLKGKKIPISKYKSKKTQFKVSSDFSSQSSSESSSDSNLSVESISVKKEKKKRKMRKSLPASDSSSSCSSVSFKISKRKSLKKGKSKKYVLSESDSELTSSVWDSDTNSSSSVDKKI